MYTPRKQKGGVYTTDIRVNPLTIQQTSLGLSESHSTVQTYDIETTVSTYGDVNASAIQQEHVESQSTIDGFIQALQDTLSEDLAPGDTSTLSSIEGVVSLGSIDKYLLLADALSINILTSKNTVLSRLSNVAVLNAAQKKISQQTAQTEYNIASTNLVLVSSYYTSTLTTYESALLTYDKLTSIDTFYDNQISTLYAHIYSIQSSIQDKLVSGDDMSTIILDVSGYESTIKGFAKQISTLEQEELAAETAAMNAGVEQSGGGWTAPLYSILFPLSTLIYASQMNRLTVLREYYSKNIEYRESEIRILNSNASSMLISSAAYLSTQNSLYSTQYLAWYAEMDAAVSTCNSYSTLYAGYSALEYELYGQFVSSQHGLSTATSIYTYAMLLKSYNDSLLNELSAITILDAAQDLLQLVQNYINLNQQGIDDPTLFQQIMHESAVTGTQQGGALGPSPGRAPIDTVLLIKQSLDGILPTYSQSQFQLTRTRESIENNTGVMKNKIIETVIAPYAATIMKANTDYASALLERSCTVKEIAKYQAQLLPLKPISDAHISTVYYSSIEYFMKKDAEYAAEIQTSTFQLYTYQSSITNYDRQYTLYATAAGQAAATIESTELELSSIQRYMATILEESAIIESAISSFSSDSIKFSSDLGPLLTTLNSDFFIWMQNQVAVNQYTSTITMNRINEYAYSLIEISTQTTVDILYKRMIFDTVSLNNDPTLTPTLSQISTNVSVLRSFQPLIQSFIDEVCGEQLVTQNYLALQSTFYMQTYYLATSSVELDQMSEIDYDILTSQYILSIQQCNLYVNDRKSLYMQVSTTISSLSARGVYSEDSQDVFYTPRRILIDDAGNYGTVSSLLPFDMDFSLIPSFAIPFNRKLVATTTIPSCLSTIAQDTVVTRPDPVEPTTTLNTMTCGVRARYVQLTKPDNNIEILQIVVIDKNGKNVAFGKPVSLQPSFLERTHAFDKQAITNGTYAVDLFITRVVQLKSRDFTRYYFVSGPAETGASIKKTVTIDLGEMVDIAAIHYLRFINAYKPAGLTFTLLDTNNMVVTTHVLNVNDQMQIIDFTDDTGVCPLSVIATRFGTCGILARYVRICPPIPFPIPFKFQQTQIVVMDSTGENMARGRAVKTRLNGLYTVDGSALVDGTYNAGPARHGFVASVFTPQDYLEIDLGSEIDITAIQFYNINDTATPTQKGLIVQLYTEDRLLANQKVMETDNLKETLDFRYLGSDANCPIELKWPSYYGEAGIICRYIRIRNSRSGGLQFTKLQAVNKLGSDIALFKNVSVSSGESVKQRGVQNVYNSLPARESFISDSTGAGQWFMVDLGEVMEICSVTIYVCSDYPTSTAGYMVDILPADSSLNPLLTFTLDGLHVEMLDTRYNPDDSVYPTTVTTTAKINYGVVGIYAQTVTLHGGSYPLAQVIDTRGINIAAYITPTYDSNTNITTFVFPRMYEITSVVVASEMPLGISVNLIDCSEKVVGESYCSNEVIDNAGVARIRYVMLTNATTPLQLSQVAIYDSNGINVALNGTCHCTSNTATGLSTPIDGVYESRWTPVFNGPPGTILWIDLGREYEIQSVYVYNKANNPDLTDRTNYQAYSAGTVVGLANTLAASAPAPSDYVTSRTLVGTSPLEKVDFTQTKKAYAADFRRPPVNVLAPIVTYPVRYGRYSTGRMARYVKVYPKNSSTPLYMSQLIVVDPTGSNIAFEKSTYSPDTRLTRKTSVAVDGKYEAHIDSLFYAFYQKYLQRASSDSFVSNLGPPDTNFWLVDLGAEYEVNSVIYVSALRYEKVSSGIPIVLLDENLHTVGMSLTSAAIENFFVDIVDFRRDPSIIVNSDPTSGDPNRVEVVQRLPVMGPRGCGYKAQYIRVEQRTGFTSPIQLSQIVILNADGINVAKFKPTYATSNVKESFKVVDGQYYIKDPTSTPTPAYISASGANQYIEVNLTAEMEITQAFLINVKNGDISNLQIKIYNANYDTLARQVFTQAPVADPATAVQSTSLNPTSNSALTFQTQSIGVSIGTNIQTFKYSQGYSPFQVITPAPAGTPHVPIPITPPVSQTPNCNPNISFAPLYTNGPNGSVPARYVRLYNVNNYVQISQLMAYDTNGVNAAYHKPCHASSVFPGSYASNAVDGEGGYFHVPRPESRSFLTLGGKYDYWQVDLGSTTNIIAVRYFPPTTHVSRNIGTRIQLLDDSLNVLKEMAVIDTSIFYDFRDGVTPDQTITDLIMPTIASISPSLSTPYGITMDSTGALYVSNIESHTVTRIVNSVATFYIGTTGTAGAGLNNLSYPAGLAYDGTHVYIADYGNNRILKATTGSATPTVTNTGITLPAPFALYYDIPSATLYASSYTVGGNVISYNGGVSTILFNLDYCTSLVYSGSILYATSGTLKTTYSFTNGTLQPLSIPTPMQFPSGLAYDVSENILFIADSLGDSVYSYLPGASDVSLLAGNGQGGLSGDGAQGIYAGLDTPASLLYSPTQGLLYITDMKNSRIRTINLQSAPPEDVIVPTTTLVPYFTTTTLGGNTSIPIAPSRTGPTAASNTIQIIKSPPTIQTETIGATSGQGVLTAITLVGPIIYYAMNFAIYKCTPVSTSAVPTTITIAGTGVQGFSGDGGMATEAKLGRITCIVLNDTFIYIVDSTNHCIRKFTVGGTIQTIVGTPPLAGFSAVVMSARETALNTPYAMAFDSRGTLYFTDSGNNRICRLNVFGKIDSYAGKGGAAGMSVYAQETTATEVALSRPLGLVFNAVNTLYFVNQGTNTIYSVTTNGALNPVCGSIDQAAAPFLQDSISGSAQARTTTIRNPIGLALDRTSNVLYVSSGEGANQIVQIANGSATIIAGFGTNGIGAHVSTDTIALYASLSAPTDLCWSSGILYIADGLRLRTLRPQVVDIISKGVNGILPYGPVSLLGANLNSYNSLLPLLRGTCVVADSAGNVYTTTSDSVIQISPTGQFSQFATGFSNPSGLCIYNTTLFVADTGNNSIKSIIILTGVTQGAATLYAGTTTAGTLTTTASAWHGLTGNCFNAPTALCSHPRGYLFIADTQGIKVIDIKNSKLQLLCNSPTVTAAEVFVFYETTAGAYYTQVQAATTAAKYGFTLATSGQVSQVGSAGATWTQPGWTSDSTSGCVTLTPSGFTQTTIISGAILCYGTKPSRAIFPSLTILPFNSTFYSQYEYTLTLQSLPQRAVSTKPTAMCIDTNQILYVATSSSILSIPLVFQPTVYLNPLYAGPSSTFVASIGSNGLMFNPQDSSIYYTTGTTLYKKAITTGSTPILVAGVASKNNPPVNGVYPASETFVNPQGVAVDLNGNIFVVDYGPQKTIIIKLTTSYVLQDASIYCIAGNGIPGGAGDGQLAYMSQCRAPSGCAFDATGNMYILDTGNHCVRKIMSATGMMTLFYGTNGTSGSTTSLLNSPRGIAVTPTGIVFVSDTGNNRIVRVNSQGTGGIYVSSVSAPGAVALDLNGNLYISTGGLIRRVSTIGQSTTIAGGGTGTPGTVAATATSVALGTVLGLTVDATGTVYAVLASNRIVTISQQGQLQSILGTGTAGWSADGPVTSATMITTNGCGGIATDKRGAIYFAEATYIRKYVVSTKMVVTVAGTGGEEFVDTIIPNAGQGGDSGLALMAQIKSPSCFAFDANTRLLLTEPTANKIRLVTCAGVATTIPIQYGLQGVRYIKLQATGVQLQIAQIVVLNTAGQNIAIQSTAVTVKSANGLAPMIVDGFYWNKPVSIRTSEQEAALKASAAAVGAAAATVNVAIAAAREAQNVLTEANRLAQERHKEIQDAYSARNSTAAAAAAAEAAAAEAAAAAAKAAEESRAAAALLAPFGAALEAARGAAVEPVEKVAVAAAAAVAAEAAIAAGFVIMLQKAQTAVNTAVYNLSVAMSPNYVSQWRDWQQRRVVFQQQLDERQARLNILNLGVPSPTAVEARQLWEKASGEQLAIERRSTLVTDRNTIALAAALVKEAELQGPVKAVIGEQQAAVEKVVREQQAAVEKVVREQQPAVDIAAAAAAEAAASTAAEAAAREAAAAAARAEAARAAARAAAAPQVAAAAAAAAEEAKNNTIEAEKAITNATAVAEAAEIAASAAVLAAAGAIYQSVGTGATEFIQLDLGKVPQEITAIIVYLRADTQNYNLTDYNSYMITISDTNGRALLTPSPSFNNFTATSIAPYVSFDLRTPSPNSKTTTDILGGFRTASPEVFCLYESSKPSPLNYTQATARTLATSLGFSLATYTQLEEALCYGANWATAGWTTGSSTIAYKPVATGIESYTPSNGLAAVLCYGVRPLTPPADITILPFSGTIVSSGAPVITPYIRYIRVSSTTSPLQIAQVIVTSAITGENLAMNKHVNTSVAGNTTGPNAVDGLAYAKPLASSYEESQAGAWWEVDLGAEMLIETVSVWSPQGSSQLYQLNGYTEKRILYPISNQ